MITVRELVTKLGFQVQDAGLRKAENRLASFKSKLTNLRNTGLAMTAAITTPLVLAGISALKTTSDFEQLNVAFETMLGSASEAKTLLSDLFAFSEKTPFNIKDVQVASKRLLAYGLASKEIIPTLTSLGNISAGIGKDKLPNLITALGQVRAKTMLSGEELRQFTETGVPLIAELAKVTGYSERKIADQTKKLGITYDQVNEALRRMSGEGGRFANLMEKQSKTLGGSWSNLEDSIVRLKAEFGELFIEDAKWAIENLREFIQWMRKLNPEVKRAIVIFGGLLAVLGLILLIFSQIGLALIGLKSLAPILAGIFSVAFLKIAAVIAVVASLIGGLWLLYDDFNAYVEGRPSAFGKVWQGISDQIDGAKKSFASFVSDFKILWENDLFPILKKMQETIKLTFDYSPLGVFSKIFKTSIKLMDKIPVVKTGKNESQLDFILGRKPNFFGNGQKDETSNNILGGLKKKSLDDFFNQKGLLSERADMIRQNMARSMGNAAMIGARSTISGGSGTVSNQDNTVNVQNTINVTVDDQDAQKIANVVNQKLNNFWNMQAMDALKTTQKGTI